jgi:hypothetical protein
MYWAMAAQAAAQFGAALFGGQQAPEMAQSMPFNPFTVDNSGWSVNFGSGSSNAAPNPVSTLAQGLANAGTAAATDPITLLLIAAVVVVVLRK